MIDNIYIDEILQKGIAAKDKVTAEFSFITLEQLNWKPSEKAWSIGECLQHLILSDSCYFPTLKKITEAVFKMSFWEKYSPFSAKCGQILKNKLQEKVKNKMMAPKIIKPTNNKISLDIIECYHKTLTTFLNYISNCKNIDIDKTIITSPTISIVTYNLRNAFHFLVQHEHRHINQAIRVKMNENFPSS
jgi:DinB superfamily